MKRVVVLAAVAVFSGFGLLAAGFPGCRPRKIRPADAVIGGKPMKAEAAAKRSRSCLVAVGG